MAGNSIGEKNFSTSETVPDQTLSIREILRRYAFGTLPPIMSDDLEYSEDLPDLRGLDISELHEMRNQARLDVKEINDELEKRKKEKETPPPPPLS